MHGTSYYRAEQVETKQIISKRNTTKMNMKRNELEKNDVFSLYPLNLVSIVMGMVYHTWYTIPQQTLTKRNIIFLYPDLDVYHLLQFIKISSTLKVLNGSGVHLLIPVTPLPCHIRYTLSLSYPLRPYPIISITPLPCHIRYTLIISYPPLIKPLNFFNPSSPSTGLHPSLIPPLRCSMFSATTARAHCMSDWVCTFHT